VPAGGSRRASSCPAATGSGGVGVFIIDPKASGVTVERQLLTNAEPHEGDAPGRPVPAGDVSRSADGVAIALARRAGDHRLLRHAGRRLRPRAPHDRGVPTERKQFDRPIATFQAVQQRAADASSTSR
jgi:alkylation response protein AidB-like acyl-CoA dehydrogenase